MIIQGQLQDLQDPTTNFQSCGSDLQLKSSLMPSTFMTNYQAKILFAVDAFQFAAILSNNSFLIQNPKSHLNSLNILFDRKSKPSLEISKFYDNFQSSRFNPRSKAKFGSINVL